MDVSLLILTTTIEKQSLLKEYPESVFQIPDMRITDRPDELFEQMHVVEKIKMLILNIDEYPDSYRTVRDQRVVPWIAHSPSLDLKAIAEAETSGACDFILGRLTLEKIFYSFQENVRFDDNDGKLNIFWQWTLPIRLEYFFAALITRRIPGSPNGISETLQDLNSPELINENYLLICF